MNIKLFITLVNLKRMPSYLNAIFIAYKNNLLGLKRNHKGMLSLPEGVALYTIAKSLPKDSVAVELGCYAGLSSSFIISGLKAGSKLFSIDPFDTNEISQEKLIKKYKDINYKKIEIGIMKNKPKKVAVLNALNKVGPKKFKLLTGYSLQVVKRWNKKIDFLWIDANHDYLAVKSDFLAWSKFIKKGGIIAFHDSNKKDKSLEWKWGWKGPTRVVNEFIKNPEWIKISDIDSITYATKNY